MDRACERCEFWRCFSARRNAAERFGLCHLLPPGSTGGDFPITERADFCREFETREPPAKRRSDN
jgi:hypothetical protein